MELAKQTGETGTEAVTQQEHSRRRLADELEEIVAHYAGLPVLDNRTDDEILGYGEDGLPGQW